MYIYHVTLQTGHSRQSWRNEIDPEALRATADLLARALQHGPVELPVKPAGYTMRATAEGRCMLATVLHDEDAPIVTLGVATTSRCGAGLWRALVTTGDQSLGNIAQPPGAPWCAVRLEVGLQLMSDAVGWLGDFERCVAWAWLDRVHKHAQQTP